MRKLDLSIFEEFMRLLIFVCLTIYLAGCSSTYQPDGFSGGFSETALGRDFYKVTFNGNGYTSSEKANDFAILRAAELALEGGYKHLIITDSDTQITSTGGNSYVPKPYNDSGFARGFAAGSGATLPIKINKPTSTIYARFVNATREMIEKNPNILDASFIAKSIKNKHKIE